MTFESFFKGVTYAEAYDAVKRLAEQGDKADSPLILCGPSGVGKTHLLRAAEAYSAQHHPQRQVLYQPLNEMIGELLAALDKQDITLFYERYAQTDLLLVDNADELLGKSHTTELLFDFFTAFLEQGHRLVLSLTTVGTFAEELAQRLLSRTASGTLLPMPLPDEATRRAIVDGLAAKHGLTLDAIVAETLVKDYTDTLTLKGAFTRLRFLSET